MTDNIDRIGQLLDQLENRYELLERGLDEAQAGLSYGDAAMVITTSMYSQPFIVGRILRPEEVELLRKFDVVLNTEESSAAFGLKQAGARPGTPEEMEERYEKGFRYGIWFHADAKVGFADYIHRSRLYPITTEELESAKKAGFEMTGIGLQTWFQDVSSRILESLEEIESAPVRLRCEKCGSPRTLIRQYYQGRMDTYGAKEKDADRIRIAGVASDQVGKITSRHVYCTNCEHEGPNLVDQEIEFVDVGGNEQSVIETVFDYGPQLPMPDWD